LPPSSPVRRRQWKTGRPSSWLSRKCRKPKQRPTAKEVCGPQT